MPFKTTALRIYGKRDLRVETFDLPEPADDEIVAEVVSNSICMSSHKAAEQGPDHKRIPNDVATNPTILGHEFSGTLVHVGAKWADKFQVGQKYAIQPAVMYKGSTDAPGYSYRWIGGNSTQVVIPQEVMLMDCLLPFEGDAFFKASLAEPMSCIVGAYRAQYHWAPGTYDYDMGIIEGGNCALLASAGPMGFGAIDFAVHGPRKPGKLIVTDIDQARLDRAEALFPVADAKANGVDLYYVNPARLGEPEKFIEYVSELTGGKMMDDVFVFYPHPAVIEQGDSILGRNGCLNFFAGPTTKDFTARLNFYDVHYEGHHIVGTSGGNTTDMRISLDLMGKSVLNPASMVTHVGGLDSAAKTILDLPEIPGGKKLIYTHINMPLTAIAQFGEAAEKADGLLKDVFTELDKLCTAANGLWCTEAEKFLLSCDGLKFDAN